MKITLLTMGTRGDTQPFISLAVRLKEQGHQVILGARPDFADLTKKYGVEFAPLGLPYKSFIMDNTKGFESGNFLKIAMQGVKQRKLMFENMGEDAYRAAQGSDAIIFKYSWFAGYSIAEKLGIPCAAAMLFPITPTKEFPCFMIGEGKNRGKLMNAVFWWVSDQVIIWQYQRSYDTKLRRKMGLRPLPFFGPHKRQAKENMPVFYAYSPTVLPKPSDWPERINVTGIWPSLKPACWEPSANLLQFLENGAVPVYIGFGSMPSNAEKTLVMILKALELSGNRGVILAGWADIGSAGKLPKTVFCVNDEPHHWLFPKMAAIVHHGGAGTTTSALLSGVPSIITPSTIDQHSWGRQVHALGAGPAPIPFKNLTPELLATAITEATTNKIMRNRAFEISKVLEKEDGLKQTLDVFVQFCNSKIERAK